MTSCCTYADRDVSNRSWMVLLHEVSLASSWCQHPVLFTLTFLLWDLLSFFQLIWRFSGLSLLWAILWQPAGETIPIRLFLGGFDLTPTFRDVNKKYSTRYYLSLVLIDEGKFIHYSPFSFVVLFSKDRSTNRSFRFTPCQSGYRDQEPEPNGCASCPRVAIADGFWNRKKPVFFPFYPPHVEPHRRAGDLQLLVSVTTTLLLRICAFAPCYSEPPLLFFA
jgi:hypothetical protein